MRIVVHDYSGHPFQVQLSRELARRGHDVLHLHFAGFQTPKAALVRRAGDPPTFAVEAIDLDRPFAKYQLVRRLLQERQLGGILAKRIRAFDPDVVISSNAPLDVQVGAYHAARSAGAAFIFWLQDVYSDAIARHLRRKLPGFGHLAALRFIALERSLLRKADRVVAITDDFRPRLEEWNVKPERVVTVENWAPLDDIAPRSKDNPWAREHGLHDRPVILYSGTLGLKHNPALLLEVAKQLQLEQPEARLVVVSEGLGADWLRERGRDLPTLAHLPFQPFDRLADVIGTADIVVAILEPDAGIFPSVQGADLPGRGSSGHRRHSGREPGRAVDRRQQRRPRGFTARSWGPCRRLHRSPRGEDDRREMGRRARADAESAFEIGRIADRFEAVLRAAKTASPRLQVQPAS